MGWLKHTLYDAKFHRKEAVCLALTIDFQVWSIFGLFGRVTAGRVVDLSLNPSFYSPLRAIANKWLIDIYKQI